jgi:isoleucyl-tRNA synthetase
MAFAKEFSTWYLRLSRERLRTNSESQAVFGYVLRKYCLLMAPFAPFMAERIYQSIGGTKDSIHLEDWPTPNTSFVSSELETQMEEVMAIVEKGHAERKNAAIRLRQPLSSITVSTKLSDDLVSIITEELNVKKLILGDALALDTTLTPELEAEGIARDLMRDIQGARKKLGLSPKDQVAVELPSWPETWTEEIKKKVGATTLTVGSTLSVTKI